MSANIDELKRSASSQQIHELSCGPIYRLLAEHFQQLGHGDMQNAIMLRSHPFWTLFRKAMQTMAKPRHVLLEDAFEYVKTVECPSIPCIRPEDLFTKPPYSIISRANWAYVFGDALLPAQEACKLDVLRLKRPDNLSALLSRILFRDPESWNSWMNQGIAELGWHTTIGGNFFLVNPGHSGEKTCILKAVSREDGWRTYARTSESDQISYMHQGSVLVVPHREKEPA